MDSPKITIEKMKPEDLDGVIVLGLATKELHPQDEFPAYYSKKELIPFIKSPNDIYLVAKVDGKFAGYRLATFNPYLKEAYLLDMVVKPEYRGLGISTLLYKKTFEILRKKKCGWAWTLVRDDNPKMKKILTKKGFHKGVKFQFFYKTKF